MDQPLQQESVPDRRDFLRRAGAWSLGLAAACRSTPSAPPQAGLAAGAQQDVPTEVAEPQPATPANPTPEPGPELAAGNLPTPDLSDERILRTLAGVRPYRRGSVRLERGDLHGRPIVHDYGHGGAGITLSFGCAAEVVQLVRAATPAPADVVVLGAGICGLTSALRLQEAGYGVRVLAREFPAETTSFIAGGQFSPSLVARGDGERLERWVRRAHASFLELAGDEFGIYRRPNYTTSGNGSALSSLPRDLVPRARLDALPFAGKPRAGFVYQTLLIEPPVFLPRLAGELEARGVTLEQRSFQHLEDLAALRADAIVDCLGLGAGTLFDDERVRPLRGQLVHLEPQELPYLLSHDGYLFPRHDAVVLGGTVERDSSDTVPDPAACRRILAKHRRFFGQPAT